MEWPVGERPGCKGNQSTQHPAGSQPGLAKGAISWGETQTARSTVGVQHHTHVQDGHPWACRIGELELHPRALRLPKVGPSLPSAPGWAAALQAAKAAQDVAASTPWPFFTNQTATAWPWLCNRTWVRVPCRRATTDSAVLLPAPKNQTAVVVIRHRQPPWLWSRSRSVLCHEESAAVAGHGGRPGSARGSGAS